MLLFNVIVFCIIDNIKLNRRKNRNSSIIRRSRQNTRRSVSFANPLVIEPVPNQSANPRQLQDIEMADFGACRSAIPPPPARAPPPLPINKQRLPTKPAPSISSTASNPLTKLPGSSSLPHGKLVTLPRPTKPADFPTFAPPPPPQMTRSRPGSLKLPNTRNQYYKTLTTIIVLY